MLFDSSPKQLFQKLKSVVNFQFYQLEQISTQKWVGLCFIDEYEVFSTWRRTGYPALVPVNYPGNLSGGTIPRRMVIGPNEQNLNSENFIAAMTRQGGADYNILTNRVWWDVR